MEKYVNYKAQCSSHKFKTSVLPHSIVPGKNIILRKRGRNGREKG
jgi:hypothetical protein